MGWLDLKCMSLTEYVGFLGMTNLVCCLYHLTFLNIESLKNDFDLVLMLNLYCDVNHLNMQV